MKQNNMIQMCMDSVTFSFHIKILKTGPLIFQSASYSIIILKFADTLILLRKKISIYKHSV